MYDFILRMALMLGLGAMIYLVARAAPRVSEETAKAEDKKRYFFNHETVEKIDVLFGNFTEKGLRKFKLLLLKLDNFTNNYLDKVKTVKSNGGQRNEEEKPTLFNGGGKE